MRKRFFQAPQKKTPHLFWFLLWWNQIRTRHQLQCLISNPIWISLFSPPMEFYIRLLFSDLKPSGFFDLPNIAGGNNFHQINRRNLLILPRRLWGGMGKPRTLWHSISFIIFPDFFSSSISQSSLEMGFLGFSCFNTVLIMFISSW